MGMKMAHQHRQNDPGQARSAQPRQKRGKYDIMAEMQMRDSGASSSCIPVAAAFEATMVIDGGRAPSETAHYFIRWNPQQQADFLHGFDNATDLMRHRMFAAITLCRNGTALEEGVSRLLGAMDFSTKALDIAMGYAEYTGSASTLVRDLKAKHQEPLWKLLAEAFRVVRSDDSCKGDTKSILHRVIRDLGGEETPAPVAVGASAGQAEAAAQAAPALVQGPPAAEAAPQASPPQ